MESRLRHEAISVAGKGKPSSEEIGTAAGSFKEIRESTPILTYSYTATPKNMMENCSYVGNLKLGRWGFTQNNKKLVYRFYGTVWEHTEIFESNVDMGSVANKMKGDIDYMLGEFLIDYYKAN